MATGDRSAGPAAEQGTRLEPRMHLGEQPLRHAEVMSRGEDEGEVAGRLEARPRPVRGLRGGLDRVEALGGPDRDLHSRRLGERHQPESEFPGPEPEEAAWFRYSRTKPSMSPSRTRWASPTSNPVRWSLTRWSGWRK